MMYVQGLLKSNKLSLKDIEGHMLVQGCGHIQEWPERPQILTLADVALCKWEVKATSEL